MKIAIPTKNNQVDDHFGHCEYFTVLTVEANQVKKQENVPSLQGCGCKSNIVNDLKAMGVELMLAGNMGQGAYNKLVSSDIKVIRGCKGDVSTTIDAYLNGKLQDSLIMCAPHDHASDHGHSCQHH